MKLQWLSVCEHLKYNFVCICVNFIPGKAPNHISNLFSHYTSPASIPSNRRPLHARITRIPFTYDEPKIWIIYIISTMLDTNPVSQYLKVLVFTWMVYLSMTSTW